MRKNKVILVSSAYGGWEGVYVNGLLINEDHTLGEGNHIKYWLDFSQKYNVSGDDIKEYELSIDDSDKLEEIGCLPANFKDFLKNYDEC